jgi:D-sedoheptulose 7-phosphate isomerase
LTPPDGALRALAALLETSAEQHSASVRRYAELVWDTLQGGGRLYFAGNGGSAADAQHCAAEYVVRYGRDRRALPAVALGSNVALLTAASNDLGYEEALAREVEALAGRGDLLILHSTSGRSPNLLAAARAARTKGAAVVGLLGRDGGPLRDLVDLAIVIAHDDTGRIQLVHMAIEHWVVGEVERRLVTGNGEPGTGNG